MTHNIQMNESRNCKNCGVHIEMILHIYLRFKYHYIMATKTMKGKIYSQPQFSVCLYHYFSLPLLRDDGGTSGDFSPLLESTKLNNFQLNEFISLYKF